MPESAAKRPAKLERQLAVVFDLNKCIGCQTCSVACKVLWTRDEGMEHQWWCTVNTQPGKGTPKDWEEMGGGERGGVPVPGHLPTREEFGGGWEFDFQRLFYGGQGNAEPLRPKAGSPEWGPNWDEDQGAGEYPNSYYFYLPRICNHCTNPVCVESCPKGAMYKRAEDGIVVRDEDACRGYRFCMEACPYKKIYFNHVRQVAQHCIFCLPRVEQGVAPACVRQCPGRLAFVGYLDDPEGPIHRLVNEWKVAMPLHPEYGTAPNVFYVPPMAPYRLAPDGSMDESQPRIPLDYLEKLFGPRVGAVLEKLRGELQTVRSGGESEMLQTLIAYEWQSLLGPFTVDPAQLATSGAGSAAGNGAAAADGLNVVEVPAKGAAAPEGA
jgi:DMSO reductase family type II enzyme iron-sulfur subunit